MRKIFHTLSRNTKIILGAIVVSIGIWFVVSTIKDELEVYMGDFIDNPLVYIIIGFGLIFVGVHLFGKKL